MNNIASDIKFVFLYKYNIRLTDCYIFKNELRIVLENSRISIPLSANMNAYTIIQEYFPELLI